MWIENGEDSVKTEAAKPGQERYCSGTKEDAGSG
jgi:hypothetical protein